MLKSGAIKAYSNRYGIGFPDHTWQEYRSPFKIILVSLDGGIKQHQSTFPNDKKLFNSIDAIHMRR
ncbi:DUF4174 domain-containing protein [Flavobacteriaceae bacterium KMM 6898]|nr:DUF4174 domain-containing protein [Flavobacteriaceae bacterium KMM 6898]